MKWQDISADIKTLSPGGCLPLPWSYIYMYKIMKKKMYKIRLRRDFFETYNKWPKWQDVPIDIKISSQGGCQPLLRAIFMYKIIKKKYIKSDFKEIFLKLVANDRSDISIDIKILSPGVVCPWPVAIYIYWKDMYKVRGWRNSF